MSEVNLVCVICQKNSSLRCGRCQKVVYCSKEHQKLDWEEHKKICRVTPSKCFEIAEDGKVGRHLISTRYISKGETVLEEAPLVTGPMYSTPPVCLGCYKLLNQINRRNCSRCNWPVCSRDCENSVAHKPECEITTKFKKEKVNITNFEIEHPSYHCITVLRCLYLRNLNKVAWEKITNLESHSNERESSERFKKDVMMVAEFIPRFFNYHEHTKEDISKMTGIVQINAHHVPFQEPGYVSIFDTASMLEHNCRANCSKSLYENGKIIVRAARPIQKGEHLSISYTVPLWGKQARQDHLFLTNCFICECERCSDPTEFGTNFNSFKCTTPDCEGYVAPHLSQVARKYNWICTGCNRILTIPEHKDFFKDINKGILNLKKENPESCKEFLMKFKQYLHQNHFCMVEVKLALIEYYEDDKICRTSDEDLNYIISVCKSLIDLTSKLVPAENRLRGVLYLRLHAALAEQGRRKLLSQEIDDSQFKQNLLMLRDILKKAYSFLKTEPEALPEGKMAIQALKYIQDIDKFMGGAQLFL